MGSFGNFAFQADVIRSYVTATGHFCAVVLEGPRHEGIPIPMHIGMGTWPAWQERMRLRKSHGGAERAPTHYNPITCRVIA